MNNVVINLKKKLNFEKINNIPNKWAGSNPWSLK